jgi:hypothetical protein
MIHRLNNDTVILGEDVCPFDFFTQSSDTRLPIFSYWALTLAHTDMDLATAFSAINLMKTKPNVIFTLSEKVSHMITMKP